MPLPATIWREIFDRLRSPHGERYAAEILDINRRYSADYVFSDGQRRYTAVYPLPSAAEIEHYHDYGHLWSAEALADFCPRYQQYLALQLGQGIDTPDNQRSPCND